MTYMYICLSELYIYRKYLLSDPLDANRPLQIDKSRSYTTFYVSFSRVGKHMYICIRFLYWINAEWLRNGGHHFLNEIKQNIEHYGTGNIGI